MRPPPLWPALFILLGLGAGCAVYPPAVFCQRDADCEDPGKVCDLATRRCVDPGDLECEPQVATACLDDALVWVDGCGQPGEVALSCECGCSSDDACDPCCTTNADCAHLGENHFCDPFSGLCDCAASCAGVCCGSDGCSGTCPEVCPPDARCDPDTCRCVADCQPATCDQLGAVCGRVADGCGGWLDCGPEQECQGALVMVCEDGAWRVDTDCGAMDMDCQDGGCAATDDLCPAGQLCNQIDDTGLLGCTLRDGSWPPDTQFDCGQTGLCEGVGAFCHFLSGVTACVRECGTCPDGQICYDVTGGSFFACLTPNYDIPYDAPTGCQANQDCPGNRLCWCLDAECIDTICLENCYPQP